MSVGSGRMIEIKRVDDLLRAFAPCRPRRRCLLALVGDGPLRTEAARRWALELGVLGRCQFLGFREDVGTLYALSTRSR